MTEPTVNEAAVETQTTEKTEVRTFNQDEVNALIQQRVDREKNKYQKTYGNVDLDLYNKLVAQEEKKTLNEKKARGEFDAILKETVSKKDAVIGNLESELRNIKVNGALLSAASTSKAVNPDQVVQLLQSQVKLNDGQVEIVDNNGQVRYTEGGDLMGVQELVGEFLQTNPHFVQAGPKGSGTQSVMNTPAKTQSFNLEDLDMTKPADRVKYAEAKSKGLI